jgi:hypothetical protein
LCSIFYPFFNPMVVDLQKKRNNSTEERKKNEWMNGWNEGRMKNVREITEENSNPHYKYIPLFLASFVRCY